MAANSFKKFIQALIEKTNEGKAIWNTTSMIGQYKIILEDSTVTIDKRVISEDDLPEITGTGLDTGFSASNLSESMKKVKKSMRGNEITLSIYNGGNVESTPFNLLDDQEEFTLLNSLYEAIKKNQQNELEERFQHLFKQIEGKEVIGYSDFDI